MSKLTEAQERWMTALESGEYKQTRSRLRDANGFCCLGVACDVSGLGEWRKLSGLDKFEFRTSYGARADLGLPFSVREQLGISHDDNRADRLVELNDHEGKTFAEIAKWIRENADEVFTQGDDK